MQWLALIAATLSIAISIRRSGDIANLFVLSNMVPALAVFILPIAAPLVLDIEITIEDPAWLFAAVSVVAKLVGYLRGRGTAAPPFDDEAIDQRRLRGAAVVSFVMFVLLFLPILMQVGVGPAFTSPRTSVYEAARLGAGHFYFLAGSALTVFGLLGLMAFRSKATVVLVCAICSLPFGNKARFLILANTVLLYVLHLRPNGRHFRQKRYLVGAGALLFVLMLAAFWYTSYGLNLSGVVELMVGFGSEYQYNFSMLVGDFHSDFHEHFWGQIFLEDNFVSLIPRALWEGKPVVFGSLRLADNVFAFRDLSGGAPSFGPFGQPFADFGYSGLIQVALQDALQGFLIGRVEARARIGSLRTFLLAYTFAFGGYVTVGGAINPLMLVGVNVVVTAIMIAALREPTTT